MKSKQAIHLQSGHVIGQGRPCFLVAEIGNNHQGELNLALEMIAAAAEAGAQAVKFQKRDTDALFTRAGREAPYGGPNSFGPTYGEHRDALELDMDDMARCKEEADKHKLAFFASSWDHVSLEQMEELGAPLHKICSADLVNIPFLRKVRETGKPVILSTGMSSLEEIDLAVDELTRDNANGLVLLHCNSSYPCPDEAVALPVMQSLARRYNLPVGYSGHEMGVGPSVAAAALGACVIERHFTLDKTFRGTDHQVSLTPAELALLAKMVREVELSLRQRDKTVCEKELASARKLRKSIVFSRDLPPGRTLTESDITVKCPGDGVSPVHWDHVLGSVLLKGVTQDEQFCWSQVAPREEREEEAQRAACLRES